MCEELQERAMNWKNGCHSCGMSEQFSFFSINTKWLYIPLWSVLRSSLSPLCVCGVQRGRKGSCLWKQHELEDKIWQGFFFPSLVTANCSVNFLSHHENNLTSPNIQNQKQKVYRLNKKESTKWPNFQGVSSSKTYFCLSTLQGLSSWRPQWCTG